MTSTSHLPSQEEARSIHERLIDGDPVASAELAIAYLDHLTEWLMRHNSRIDPHVCATAAEDAILALIRRPDSFQRNRQSLDAFLRMSALGDLRNLLRSERRHSRRRVSLEAVEVSSFSGKYLRDPDMDPASIVEHREEVERRLSIAMQIPDSVRESLSQAESQVLELMLLKERRTAAYAAILGIEDEPSEVQRREVKRMKDRLSKRLDRASNRE